MGNSTQTNLISDIYGSAGILRKIILRLPIIFINLFINLFCFAAFYFLKKQSLVLSSDYIDFLKIYFLAWAIGGVLSGKFRYKSFTTVQHCLTISYTSLLVSLGIISFFLNIYDLLSISRFIVIGSLSTSLIIEVAFNCLLNKSTLKYSNRKKSRIAFTAPLIDLTILSVVLAMMFVYKFKLGSLDENHFVLLSGSYLSWLLAALITHQFKPFPEKNDLWNAVSIQLKFYLLIFALMSIIVYILQIDQSYRTYYIQGIIIYSVISFYLLLFLYMKKLPQRIDDVTTKFLQTFEFNNHTDPKKENKTISSKYKLFSDVKNGSQYQKKLKLIYFMEYPEVFSFIESKLDLRTFDYDKTTVLKSRDPYNVTVFPQNYLKLFINLYKLNDIRWINEYFREVNNRLCEGGIFVGNFEPNRFRYDRFRTNYPFLLANTLFFIDLLWKRVIPNLPIINKIYFMVSNGKNRALPLAEGFGRLYYCGFELTDLKVINNLCYFIAKKISEPSPDKHPSRNLIIKMSREGKNGKQIHVYKLRTMHPYSEYLQNLIYNNNRLEINGKFKDDFRIPKWGKVFRKFWIDEIPMIANLLKGDLKLVGVRPITKQYLCLYDEEFRKRRKQYKPGLIPPYYADLPKGIYEIIKSEEKYLNEYDKHRFKTDFKYLIKIINNIVLNNQRSG